MLQNRTSQRRYGRFFFGLTTATELDITSLQRMGTRHPVNIEVRIHISWCTPRTRVLPYMASRVRFYISISGTAIGRSFFLLLLSRLASIVQQASSPDLSGPSDICSLLTTWHTSTAFRNECRTNLRRSFQFVLVPHNKIRLVREGEST